MAVPSGPHVLLVPDPLATRLDRMVDAGEFESFAQAAVAMIELGVVQHDGRVLPPAAGPPPPTMPKGIPPPGPPASGPPLGADAQGSSGEARRSPRR